jgi:membrane-associated phospholipid phosphatase
VFALGGICVYLWIQAVAGPPRYDFSLPVDGWIPFVPASILIYLGYYLYVLLLLGTLNRRRIALTIAAASLSLAIACVCFYCFPAATLRPMPEGWTAGIYSWLHSVDQATNTFPSLHVTMTVLAYLAAAPTSQHPRALLALATLICLSTMTTRQHVLADVIAGALLAWLTLKGSEHVLGAAPQARP